MFRPQVAIPGFATLCKTCGRGIHDVHAKPLLGTCVNHAAYLHFLIQPLRARLPAVPYRPLYVCYYRFAKSKTITAPRSLECS
ncbi:hypothetical protein PISMIDRAFT_670994 [Pisolithus microcarpus 441]|uniref:Uncharacterized protein n=1 Tax=Pisolithus microcarpus 441 TaxID=765257 RepID=A0A0C9ZXP7_9AGAM|nr:hypothetical protein PISMIDRAFT_670994 [Pisolithus microcarpus 441]